MVGGVLAVGEAGDADVVLEGAVGSVAYLKIVLRVTVYRSIHTCACLEVYMCNMHGTRHMHMCT